MNISEKRNEEVLPDWVNNVVLVYGPRKGGTTMLQNLLDRDRDLIMYPVEVKLKHFTTGFFESSRQAASEYFNLSRIFNNEYPNFNTDHYKKCAQRLKGKKHYNLKEIFCHDIYSLYSSVREKPYHVSMWAMKEVGGNTPAIMALFKNLFIDGKVIMITRNPLMVTRSIILDRRRRGINMSYRDIFKEFKSAVKVFKWQQKYIHYDSVHFVTYENLTGGYLENEMKKICDFLNISFSKINKNTTLFGHPTITRTSSKKTSRVFVNVNKWYDSLFLKEIITIYLSSFLIYLNNLIFLKDNKKTCSIIVNEINNGK